MVYDLFFWNRPPGPPVHDPLAQVSGFRDRPMRCEAKESSLANMIVVVHLSVQ